MWWLVLRALGGVLVGLMPLQAANTAHPGGVEGHYFHELDTCSRELQLVAICTVLVLYEVYST